MLLPEQTVSSVDASTLIQHHFGTICQNAHWNLYTHVSLDWQSEFSNRRLAKPVFEPETFCTKFPQSLDHGACINIQCHMIKLMFLFALICFTCGIIHSYHLAKSALSRLRGFVFIVHVFCIESIPVSKHCKLCSDAMFCDF